MFFDDPAARLKGLTASGQLRFVYVIGVARSNSTVICRMLGARLDGAVYEPAMPSSPNPERHFSRTILKAYDHARRKVPEGQPVVLAIKDIALFITEPVLGFIRAHAEHVVLTIRDPASQHASLVNQFKREFSIRHRVVAFWRHPVEVMTMGFDLMGRSKGFIAAMKELVGLDRVRPLDIAQLVVGGWNLESWRSIGRQARQLGGPSGPGVTVLDAALMRQQPAETMMALEAIATAIRPAGTASTLEVAGHSRMRTDSTWVAEARTSSGIKPAAAAPKRDPLTAIEQRLVALLHPNYQALLEQVETRQDAPARLRRSG